MADAEEKKGILGRAWDLITGSAQGDTSQDGGTQGRDSDAQEPETKTEEIPAFSDFSVEERKAFLQVRETQQPMEGYSEEAKEKAKENFEQVFADNPDFDGMSPGDIYVKVAESFQAQSFPVRLQQEMGIEITGKVHGENQPTPAEALAKAGSELTEAREEFEQKANSPRASLQQARLRGEQADFREAAEAAGFSDKQIEAAMEADNPAEALLKADEAGQNVENNPSPGQEAGESNQPGEANADAPKEEEPQITEELQTAYTQLQEVRDSGSEEEKAQAAEKFTEAATKAGYENLDNAEKALEAEQPSGQQQTTQQGTASEKAEQQEASSQRATQNGNGQEIAQGLELDMDAPFGRESAGAYVQKLQEGLMELGYDLSQYGADGVFGEETRQALIEFQQKNGLDVDGVAGSQSLGRMDALLEAKGITIGDGVDGGVAVEDGLQVPSGLPQDIRTQASAQQTP